MKQNLLSTLLKLLITITCFISQSQLAYAQTAVLSSGGNASNNTGSVSYSIGQVTYQEAVGTNGSMHEGVQQAFEISIVSTKDWPSAISLEINAYPNPVRQLLCLQIEELSQEDLFYEVLDMNGKRLLFENVLSTQTFIQTDDWPVALYFLKVYTKNEEIKTFKIIKN